MPTALRLVGACATTGVIKPMTVRDFRVEAFPAFSADPDDIDATGLLMTDDQRGQLDRAKRLLEKCPEVLGLLENVAMGLSPQAGLAVDLLSYIRHGDGLDGAVIDGEVMQ